MIVSCDQCGAAVVHTRSKSKEEFRVYGVVVRDLISASRCLRRLMV